MKSISKSLQRGFYSAAALLFASMTFMPLAANAAAVGGQVQTRYLKMGSSKPSDTNVKYSVSFKPASSYTLMGIIVDFCDSASSPLVGTSCTAPAGFSVGATPTFTNNPDGNATVAVTGWTAASANTNRTFQLTNATGVAVTSSSIVNFSIDTVTNPSSTGTFYARVLTYTTNTPTYTAGSEGTYQDYGGFALSTAAAIDITARVMETLSFCVYKTSCGTAPAVELGTGSPAAISTSLSTSPNLNFSLSTNALNGATIRLKGDTLKSGSNSLAAAGSTAVTIGTGSGLFGLNVASITATSGTMTADPNYTGASKYGLDTTNTLSNYGDILATSSGALDTAIGTFSYGAAAATTTPAGIYTAQHQLIATGTF